MIIKLTSGNLLFPRDVKIDIESYGVKIEGWNNYTIIPHSQIKWIYKGDDFKDEEKVYTSIKAKKRGNPIEEIDRQSSEDLLKGLWR